MSQAFEIYLLASVLAKQARTLTRSCRLISTDREKKYLQSCSYITLTNGGESFSRLISEIDSSAIFWSRPQSKRLV